MPIAIGTKAPDFTLKTSATGGLKDVKLSDNFGKRQTLILFVALAFTGVCTQEMCAMSARAAFVIGKDGVVTCAEQTATPEDLPNFAAIKAAIAK